MRPLPGSSRRLSESLFRFLSQGITPGRLALTLALGITLSCFPVFGATTILCAIVALVFRLNLPAIEVGNYLALPLQFILLVPFLRLGERLFHSPRMPLAPGQLIAMMRGAPDATMRLMLAGQWHAIVAWMLFAPWMVLLIAAGLRPLLSKLQRRVPAWISGGGNPLLIEDKLESGGRGRTRFRASAPYSR